MKELTIEEKAKRYDEALEKLRSLHDDYDTVSTLIDIKEELKNIFPELKESENEKAIRDIKVVLESSATKFFKKEGKMPIWYDRAVAWLEKQGEQKRADKVEPKSAWSEEDKKMFDAVISDLERHGGKEGSCYSAEINWLKSLKERYTWKPSDEQMDAVKDAIDYLGGNTKIVRKHLMSLYDQLKKLREK